MKKNILYFLLLVATLSLNAQCYESLKFGGTHTIGIKSDGTLWGWGRRADGQLGDNILSTQPVPLQITSMSNSSTVYPGVINSFIIKSDGSMWGSGSNTYGSLGINSTTEIINTFQQITTATNWVKVSPSLFFAVALRSDGTIWAWGQDDFNQTGNPPSSESQNVPVQVGTGTDWIDVATNTDRTAFALKADGTLWGWGENAFSLLVPASNVYSLPVPTQINSVNTWVKMSVGGTHILAQKNDGTLWAWGSGAARGVGPDINPGIIPNQIGTDTWKYFTTGGNTSFGVKTDGTLWAWGNNLNGKLGDGTTITRFYPVQIGSDTNWDTVQARNYATTMATKTDGSIYYWGTNYYGEFGNGTDYNEVYYTSPQLTPNICVNSLTAPSFDKKEIVNVYPNPASGTVQVQYDLGVSNATIDLYDITGRLLNQKALTDAQGTTVFDINNYTAGMYIVVIRNENHILFQQKLIIK